MRARDVRCMTQNDVAIRALPPKPNITDVVWTGLILPKLD
jgi:hypothetical protein